MKQIKLFFLLIFALLLTGCFSKEVEVTFVGFDNEVISVQVLEKGDLIQYPDDPEIEGYEFLGWDQMFTYAEENVTITAQFEQYKFIVSFYDKSKNLIEEQEVGYGEDAVAPDFQLPEGYILMGWDEDFTNVTCDINVYGIFEKATFEVTFKDSYGQVLDVQTVKNGESAVSPEEPIIEGYQFVKWDIDYTNVKRIV